MELITFFITYLLFLLTSGIVITAFFCITRGYTEILPDGTENRYGKIFKSYFFFWFKEKNDKEKIVYKDDELAGLVDQISGIYKEPICLSGDPLTTGSITRFVAPKDIVPFIPLLRKKLEIQFEIEKLDDETVSLSVYQSYPVYIFPEWIRTVMAGCITCTPTVYGNIVYWCAICFLKKETLSALFSSFNSVYAGVILTWIAYWISLAWLNTVLWNIYNKQ